MNDYVDRILAWLAKQGVKDAKIKHNSKHPRIVFTWRRKQLSFVIAGSPGDTLRGSKNSITELRHMMGLVPSAKRVGTRRARKSVRAKSAQTECPTITPLPDWRVELLATRTEAELAVLADIAWLNFWHACMASVGGKSLLKHPGAA